MYHEDQPDRLPGPHRGALEDDPADIPAHTADVEERNGASRDRAAQGVFEPGEDVLVDYEVVNYGGGTGRLPGPQAAGRSNPT